MPKSNTKFWQSKIERNRARDQENYRVLQENGWLVIVVWECQLTPKRIDRTMREMELLLNDNLISLYKRHTTIPYSINEEYSPLPLAAEDSLE